MIPIGNLAIGGIVGGQNKNSKLQKEGRLVAKPMNAGVAIALGIAIGISIGSGTNHLAVGLGTGVAFGALLAIASKRLSVARG